MEWPLSKLKSFLEANQLFKDEAKRGSYGYSAWWVSGWLSSRQDLKPGTREYSPKYTFQYIYICRESYKWKRTQ
jgi:hypothetical protein